jgi:hypothetical protein
MAANIDTPAGSLAALIRQAGRDIAKVDGDNNVIAPIFDVLTYAESSWGLGMKLYPVQRFIIKLYYGLDLSDRLPDDLPDRIVITDMFKTRTLYEFTEVEYLHYLYNEGRCNINEPSYDRRELVLAVGRRSGKTAMAGIFASYEVYRLLNLYDPQAYYGLIDGSRIQLTSIGTDKEQAGLLFNEVATHVGRCSYFKPFIANNNLTFMNFRTPRDLEKHGVSTRESDGKYTTFSGKASIRVTFKPCVARSLRGPGNILVVLDEVAHYLTKGGRSAEEIYSALTPSTAAYTRKDPITKRILIDSVTQQEALVESRIILISSPLGKSGKFFDQYDLAMRNDPGAAYTLAIQAPTWEVNPTVSGAYFRTEYHKNAVVFMTEYGARFSDQSVGWIERKSDLLACVDRDLRPKSRARPREPHQMGLDVGLVNDGTVICITHPERNTVVLDYHEVWRAGCQWKDLNPHLEGRYSTEFAKSLQDVERLDFDEIAKWIELVCSWFHVTAGLFDRWNGLPLEQTLHKKGLKQFTSQFFTPDQRSKMFQNAKMLMYDGRLRLYDYPIPERARDGERHSDLILELFALQATLKTKYMVNVQAPQKHGSFDDSADAYVRAVSLSSEFLENQKHAATGSLFSRDPTYTTMTPRRYQMMRARRHGVSPRFVPRRARF